MKTPRRRQLRRCALATVTLLAVSSCNEDQTAEVEKLTEELGIARENYESQRALVERRDEEIDKAYQQVSDLKSELRSAEKDLRRAENELERFRRKEEAAMKAAEKPDVRQMRVAAKETAAGLGGSRVEISGDATDGLGVLVADGDKTWIYCGLEAIEKNAKLEIKTADGTPLREFGSFELAKDAAMARLEVTAADLEAIALPDNPAELDRSAYLLSFDAEGKLIEGRSYGDAAAEGGLRVDSRIGACPAGSPVFHGETAALVGLLVPARDSGEALWPDRLERRRQQPSEVARVDGETDWTAVPIGAFLEEARLLETSDRMTRLVHAFAATSATASGLNHGSLEGGPADQVLEQEKELAAVKALRELDSWLKENAARTSKSDVGKKIEGVYRQMERDALRQARELEGHRFSEPHAAAAARSIEWRKEAMKALEERISRLE